MPLRPRRLLRTLAGIAAALLALEAGLRFFATTDPVPPPRIGADSIGGKAIVRRQLQEGVSRYSFSRAGARLTGNQPAASGRTAVILGDSYVVAAQVGDRETMGSRLESIARSANAALDVRQYGWSNAAPAQYLLVSDDVRRRWSPEHVFIVLSEDDLDHRSQTAAGPRLRVDRNDRVRVIGGMLDTMPAPPRRALVLYDLARYRWHILGLRFMRRLTGQRQELVPDAGAPVEPPPDSTEMAAMPRAVVTSLAARYGAALTLVLVASPGVLGDSTSTPIESRFLEACAGAGVDCISTRAAMVAARSRGEISHGTSTTEIGHGHLTPAGHGVVAALMWERMRTR